MTSKLAVSPLAVAAKAAVGGWFAAGGAVTVTSWLTEEVAPSSSLTVSFTV